MEYVRLFTVMKAKKVIVNFSARISATEGIIVVRSYTLPNCFLSLLMVVYWEFIIIIDKIDKFTIKDTIFQKLIRNIWFLLLYGMWVIIHGNKRWEHKVKALFKIVVSFSMKSLFLTRELY